MVGLVLTGGGAFGFYLIRKMKKSNRLPEPNETMTHTRQSGDEVVEAESYVITLQLLSDANIRILQEKQGWEGGFGPVYRVYRRMEK